MSILGYKHNTTNQTRVCYLLCIAVMVFLFCSCGQSKKEDTTKPDFNLLTKSIEKNAVNEKNAKEAIKPDLVEHAKKAHEIYKRYNKVSPVVGYIVVRLTINPSGKIDKVVLQSNVPNSDFLKEVKEFYEKVSFKPTSLDTSITIQFENRYEK
jgi:TonB family protein